MKKIFISGAVALLTIPSLCYYIAKYYADNSLSFEESMFTYFVLFCSLIIFGIMLGVYNACQNFQLHNEIIDLKEKLEQYHYDNLEYHENNREIMLDGFDKMGG